MQSKLTPKEAALLNLGIYLSRETKLFTLKKLGTNWEISHRTLFRYNSPHDRDMSRKAAQSATERDKQIDRTLCFKCKDPIKGHLRCKDCTILLHGADCNCISNAIALTLARALHF